jgi:hypothetical protein
VYTGEVKTMIKDFWTEEELGETVTQQEYNELKDLIVIERIK